MKKAEVIEKVKEIKQRQQNWLKQREEDKKNNATCIAPIKKRFEFKSALNVKSSSDIRLRRGSTNKGSNSSSHQLLSVDKQVREINHIAVERASSVEKFKSWRQSQNSQLKEDESCKSESSAKCTDAAARKVSSDGECTDSNSVTQPAARVHARLISPEQFNELADKIVSKVKNDLHISETGFTDELKNELHISETGFSDEPKNELQISETGLSDQVKKELQISEMGLPENDGLFDRSLSSHQCGICSKLMINRENQPMLLIPCGHSLCKYCSEGCAVCPICRCSVSSLVCNLTLQQIIQQYQSNRRRTGRPPRNMSYSPNKYTDIKDNSYQDKLEMLRMRLEVLKEEKDCELSVYTELSTDLNKEEQQLDNIGRQEASVSRQLASLKEKLTILEQHKSECESRCCRMKVDQEEARKRVSMLQDTIQSLSAEIDKVHLLSEGCCMVLQTVD